jgi:alpha-beta hydrolase superfamily lysophospholipase
VDAISRDPKVVQDYVADPLVFHEKTPARLGGEMISAILKIGEEAGKIQLPLILLHGTEDQLTDPRGSQELYDNIQSKDKTLKWYEGFYHELFNDPEGEIVLTDVENWLEAQLES